MTLRGMTKRKSDQIADLKAQREHIGSEIARLRDKLAALEHQGRELGSRILNLEMSGRVRVGKHALSNAIIHQVWRHIERLSWDGRGIPASDLFAALRTEISGLHQSTLRVYLHRLKEKGLIEKRGSAWHRTLPDIHNTRKPAAINGRSSGGRGPASHC